MALDGGRAEGRQVRLVDENVGVRDDRQAGALQVQPVRNLAVRDQI